MRLFSFSVGATFLGVWLNQILILYHTIRTGLFTQLKEALASTLFVWVNEERRGRECKSSPTANTVLFVWISYFCFGAALSQLAHQVILNA